MWLLLELCHTYRKEIISTFNTFNDFGASDNLIAAAISLKDWKNFFGDLNWTPIDVQELLQRHGSKKKLGTDGPS